jgi:hypothetical protein
LSGTGCGSHEQCSHLGAALLPPLPMSSAPTWMPRCSPRPPAPPRPHAHDQCSHLGAGLHTLGGPKGQAGRWQHARSHADLQGVRLH